MKLRNWIAEFRSDEGGATAIEYGLVVGIVSAAIIGIWGAGGSLGNLYDTISAIVDAMT